MRIFSGNPVNARAKMRFSMFGAQVDLNDRDNRFAFVFFICMLFGCVLNLITILVMVGKRKFRKTYHSAYINLAVSDFLMCVFGAFIRGQGYFRGFYSHASCETVVYFSLILPSINFLAVVPITLDRFIAVMTPHKYNTRAHYYKQVIATSLTWIIPITMALCQLVYTLQRSYGSCAEFYNGKTCNSAPWFRKTFFYHFPTAVCGLFALAFSVGCYVAICSRLYSSKHRCRKTMQILLRSVLLCFIFAVSFIPAFIVVDVLENHLDCYNTMCVKTLMYLNTLTDPVLYVFSNKAISLCTRRQERRCDCTSRKKSVISIMSRILPNSMVTAETPN